MPSNPNIQGGHTITKPMSNCRWLAVALVCGLTTINYIDRVNIGIAAPILMKELALSPASMGFLMSVFFWSYFFAMAPTGWFLNKYGPKLVMFWSCFGWGATTMLTGLVQGFYSFLAVRVALGVTEAPGFPGSIRVVQVWVPERERTLASSLFDSCARLGNAFAPPLVAAIIVAWGWQWSFVVTGGLAVLYSFVWLWLYKEPEDHPRITESELAYIRQNEKLTDEGKVVSQPISMIQLLTYPRVLLACLGMVFYMYFFSTFNMWIPSYLVAVRGFDIKAMGIAAMYPYIVGVVLEIIGGYVFDQWYRHGASISALRRTGMGVGLLGGAIGMYLTVQASSPEMAVFWLCVAMGVTSFGASNVSAIPSDIAPYGQSGGVASVIFAAGSIGSMLGPIITGIFASGSMGYNGGLLAMGFCTLLGSICYMANTYKRLEPRTR
jgi:ACS family glucarate transporter-like MFS transporter